MYICTRIRLCGFLTSKGFQYEKTEPNVNNPKLKVWFYKDTPELRLAIKEYYSLVPENTN